MHVDAASDNDTVDLWLTDYQQVSTPALAGPLRALLDAAERAQEGQFLFADDRLRYLVTRALVRTVLSRYAQVAPSDWEFVQNSHGRPHISPRHGALDLSFNLSHSKGLVALAVSRQRAIGVDVENVMARPASPALAERFFAAEEACELMAVPPALRAQRFFEYWTLKEAYVKARGIGMSLPLDRFSFHFPGSDALRVAFHPGFDDEAERWCFWLCQPTPAHQLALCAQRTMQAAPRITVRSVLPTLDDVPTTLAWTRTNLAGQLLAPV
jgi:4'-phosphopantetheinyl transferase